MPNEVKTIIKTASDRRKKQEKRRRLLEKMGICIDTQKALEDRIKKLITSLVIN